MPTQQIARMTFLGLGLAAAAGIVAILSLVLPPGSTLAVLLLDLQAEGANMFTYPLTIQNFCWLLFGVGVGDVLHRKLAARREVRAVKLCLLPEDDKTILVLEDLPSIRQRVLQVGRTKGGFLCRLIDECVLYFGANRDPGQTMNLMTTLVDLEAHRVDLRYTLLRYLAWILPTLGFIGTMVGIAGSLRMINPPGGEAIDMEGVVATLSVAFNTTIMALLFSAVLVLMIQFTQRSEEEALNDSGAYCLRNLVNRLYTPPSESFQSKRG